MDLQRLYAGSFIDWEVVAASWNKRTVPSRLLLFAARRYLEERAGSLDSGRVEMLASAPLPEEIKHAFASPPELDAPASRLWGEFVDAAVAAELEMVSYGERPPLLHELRAGLEQAAGEAGPLTETGRWFLARRDALPGTDLPEDPGYLPI
ncbi:MAG: hypothetical protein M3Q62_08050 [Actinomycetota bacterium]|jgi:hypothetical protein|nr:hypothetical protein [Rubrobacteraceae bacterium]MDQ3183478.1 hypothetical protein [Actinomycetota bacterium]MBA3636909.1 hypothetical protein [Rubrobacteraceae bacterium]MBA3703027.1 hypothetical protein [Rubrobacteraceae bacterium]MDQ3496145.1 hypothetical protein [Actinomycetota bacterium]